MSVHGRPRRGMIARGVRRRGDAARTFAGRYESSSGRGIPFSLPRLSPAPGPLLAILLTLLLLSAIGGEGTTTTEGSSGDGTSNTAGTEAGASRVAQPETARSVDPPPGPTGETVEGNAGGTAPTADGGLSVTFLDVGQGSSALLKLPNGATVLIDGARARAGPRGSGISGAWGSRAWTPWSSPTPTRTTPVAW
jgi:hypothetical protein